MDITIYLLIAFVAGGLTMFTGLFYGLKFNVQINRGEQPKVEIPNPIKPIVEHFNEVKQEKLEKEAVNILDEYLNGASEK